MYARIVELNLIPEKREEFVSLINNEFLPLVQRQTGYKDGVALSAESDSNRGVSISFWSSRQEAERFYSSPEYRQFLQRIQAFVRDQIKITTYNVETSTYHHIAAGRAA